MRGGGLGRCPPLSHARYRQNLHCARHMLIIDDNALRRRDIMKKSVRTRKVNDHYETLLCQCGCGQYFTAIYHTRRPKYIDEKHKAVVNNAARATIRSLRVTAMWARRRQCIKEARTLIKRMKLEQAAFFDGDRRFEQRILMAVTERLMREKQR